MKWMTTWFQAGIVSALAVSVMAYWGIIFWSFNPKIPQNYFASPCCHSSEWNIIEQAHLKNAIIWKVQHPNMLFSAIHTHEVKPLPGEVSPHLVSCGSALSTLNSDSSVQWSAPERRFETGPTLTPVPAV